MITLHHPPGGFPLDPQSEANELRDIGASELSPTLGSPITWDDVDRRWAAEMERRDRRAACPAGYRDAPCEACGIALYAPIGQGGDILCEACRTAGEAAAVEEDDDPRPTTAGAIHPDRPHFAALAVRLLDDQLCEAISVADEAPDTFLLVNPEQREAFLRALSDEVVVRLEGRRAA